MLQNFNEWLNASLNSKNIKVIKMQARCFYICLPLPAVTVNPNTNLKQPYPNKKLIMK